MTNIAIIAGLLHMAHIVDAREAAKIQEKLIGMPVPKDWQAFITQIESIIERPITL